MSHHGKNTPRSIRFLFENSLFLVGGALIALIWANIDSDSYHKLVEFDLGSIFVADDIVTEAATEHAAETGSADHATAASGHAAEQHGEQGGGGHHGLTIHFLVNDLLMALFFAIAGKEVWESFLPGGALSNPRKAATPLLATLGGIVGPAGLYLAGALLLGQSGWFGQEGQFGRGWAIPCATDIAFSYLVARLIFGNGHPAIAFLLLLAIADDAAGLMILAVAYPQQPIEPVWFLLTAGAMLAALLMRRARLHSFWWYLLVPGVMCWVSFYFAGIHAALGLVPIIPFLPHAHTDLGIFARNEMNRLDTLNEFEHWWKNPVELVLGLFGLVNAGVVMGNVGAGTALVLIGLIIGKPLGITLFTWIAERFLGLEVPAGMNYRHIVTLGTVAGIGFTVALFVSEAAYPAGAFAPELRDSVKMGALASFFAGVIAFAVARALGVRPETASETAPQGDQLLSSAGEWDEEALHG